MGIIGTYLLTLVGVVFLIVIVQMLLPEGKISKYIRSIMGIFIVGTIMLPIARFADKDWDFGSIFNFAEYQVDETAISNINGQTIQMLEQDMQKYLDKNGYQNVQVDIVWNMQKGILKINYVYINLASLVINKNIEHIDYYTKIKNLICEQFDIEEASVIIYGKD